MDEMMKGNFKPEMLQALMSGGKGAKDPLTMIKMFMNISPEPNMIEPMLDKIDMIKQGGELIEMAISLGKADLIDLFIQKGADIMLPPDVI